MKRFFYFLSLLALLSPPVQAQVREPVVTQTIEVIMLEEKSLSSTFYYVNPLGEYANFSYGIRKRGKANTQVLSNQFLLYRKVLDEDNQEVMQPTLTIPIPNEPEVMVFFYGDQSGKFQYHATTNKPEDYPAGSARVINLTPDRAICHIAGENYAIAPKGEVVATNILKGSKGFTFGFAIDSANHQRHRADISKLRLGHPSMRFLAVFAYKSVVSEDARIPTDVRLYDIVKSPSS